MSTIRELIIQKALYLLFVPNPTQLRATGHRVVPLPVYTERQRPSPATFADTSPRKLPPAIGVFPKGIGKLPPPVKGVYSRGRL
eukprot:2925836-Rhodomonas_salina.1